MRKLCLAIFFGVQAIWAGDLPKVSLALDLPLLGIAAGTGLYGAYKLNNTDVPDSMRSKEDLYAWDKPFAGSYSGKADLVSDILNVGLGLPLVIGGVAYAQDHANGDDLLSVVVMYAEALALQSGVNLVVRSELVWPRPYMYGSHHRDGKKGEAYGSFYSGHVSAMFTSAVFSTYAFDALYPESRYFWPVALGSFSAATATAVLRVGAGKHYPTDVVVGALAGTSISLAIIQMHRLFDRRVSFVAAPGYAGTVIHF